MPTIFCVIEIASNELVFSSSKYSAASSFLRAVPYRIRDYFALVRYDANENWEPSDKDISEN